MLTNTKMHWHIQELSDDLECKIIQEDNMPGMMYVEFSYVEGPTIRDDFSHHGRIVGAQAAYMTNLHELGHFALGHTQGRPPKSNEKFYFDNGVLKSEAEAWEWALEKSLIKDYTEECADFMGSRCIGSYMAGAWNKGPQRLGNGNRHHVEFYWDEITPFVKGIQTKLLNIHKGREVSIGRV